MPEVKIAKVKVYEHADGWHFRAVGRNGEPIAWGESYVNKADAFAAARAVAGGAPVVEEDDE